MKSTKKNKLFLFALCFGAFFILFGNNSKVNAHLTLQVKNTSVLNVRAAENSNANTEILGVLYKGDTINVDFINKETGWAKLSSSNFIRESASSDKYIKLPKNKTGYCNLSYLKMPSKNILSKAKSEVIVYQDYSDTTSNTSRKIATIKKGKQVKVVWTNKHWAKLAFGGYCLKKDLKEYAGAIKYVYNTPTLNVRSSAYVLDTNKKGELTPKTKVYVVETVRTKDKQGNEYKWARLKNGTYCCLDYLTSSETEAMIYSEILADEQAAAHYNNNVNTNTNTNTNTSNTQIKTESTPHFTTSLKTYVYEKPNTNSPVHEVLKQFSIINVVDWKEGWYEIYGGYYIQSKDVSLYISSINAYLATSSPEKGQIVLNCDNGQKLIYDCNGGTQGFPTPLLTYIEEMPHIFWPGYVEIEDSLAEKILQFIHKDSKIYITREAP